MMSLQPEPGLTMRARVAFVLIFLCANLSSGLRGDFPRDLAEASGPLRDGVPEVAIVRLQSLLETKLSPDQRRLASANLVQALVAVGRATQALDLIKRDHLVQSSTEKFWNAQALSAVGRWSDALPLYDDVAADKTSPLNTEAAFCGAETLRALQKPDQAVARLKELLQLREWQARAGLRLASLYLDRSDADEARRTLEQIGVQTAAERKEHRFLRGRLAMIEHRPDRALSYLEPLATKPREVSHPLLMATLFLIADAHLGLKTPENGDDFLETFIDHHPADPALPEVFQKLDQLYRAEKKPVRAELERWTRESEQPRRGLAQWYLARIELRGGRRDRAETLLRALRTSHANLPELAGGLLELAEQELEDRKFSEVISTADEAKSWRPTPELRNRLQFVSARAQYALGDFQPATDAFDRIHRAGSALSAVAVYNSSLGWLRLADRAHFTAAYNDMQAHGAPEDDRAELRLQDGLLRARQQQSDAADTLRKFIADFPHNPRVSEAWVALAELSFHQDPVRTDEARKLLARAADAHPTAAAKERGEYLMIWIEDATSSNSDKVIQLAKEFLVQQPGSAFVPDVRMKLAEAFYLRQDFSNAQTQFELFAQQNPTSPLIEKALFFAAESAMASMGPKTLDRAIVLFDRVAQMKGELRSAARNEQALIERRLGKPQDALLLYDEVLKNEAKPGEKREALCGKGDVYLELSTSDPANYQKAIESYDRLAANAGDASHWHNQALFKKGVCLEKRADPEAALATFYEVLESSTKSDRPPELFWFYKAGFNAARLLENNSKWDSAAKVYQKLAATGGTRSEEARLRLNRLRLEHFLWSE